ncbi:FAD-dependent pyridine nucleotide-disulfide oxidoreductase [Penicillium hispanicum]|uniref:FAD-dependent pyridine nucleotide-disulfide oxidoreductase n=1 Tax=Penicillium hispanicum TaxID=1080232 RepID=UPI0025403096|nr:FAD-dependent pyridine nucleotide-disulfide oxidoreductase [Penicillium hispanicum]KAJ5591538.1 FAD-dependent pyridine nucleotide-disulfide oxidoreductase [Penicillium hispanicum]
MIFDALIIGGGPAGLSAALALGRVKRTALVFDSGHYRNLRVEAMHTVLSRDGIPPTEFREIGRRQIEDKYPHIQFTQAQVQQASQADVGDGYMGFQVTGHQDITYKGRKLILALGSEDLLPTNIEGYRENWPSHIYQCLFCDGYEKQGQPVGILEFSSPAYLGLALMSRRLSEDVTIYSNGPVSIDANVQSALRTAYASGVKLDNRPIRRLIDQGETIGIEFEDAKTVTLGMLLHKPPTINRSQNLIDSLGLTTMEQSAEVMVNPLFCESSLPGCFVAGDGGQLLKQVAIAMSTGVRAAAGVSFQLCNEEGTRALAGWDEKGEAPIN